MKREFASRGASVLKAFVPSELLRCLWSSLGAAKFNTIDRGWFSEDRLEVPHPLVHHLHFHLNNPALHRVVESVTGSPTIHGFRGRVYRRTPGPHKDDWHDDCLDGRLVGLSLNLTPHAFEGGELILRRKSSQEVIYQYANTGLGDAVVFSIDAKLQHKVEALSGTASRTVFAGWFGESKSVSNQSAPVVAPPKLSKHSLTRRWRIPATTSWHAVNEGLEIHNLESDQLIALDTFGVDAWTQLQLCDSVESCVSNLLKDYEADPRQMTQDVQDLVNRLVELGCIESL